MMMGPLPPASGDGGPPPADTGMVQWWPAWAVLSPQAALTIAAVAGVLFLVLFVVLLVVRKLRSQKQQPAPSSGAGSGQDKRPDPWVRRIIILLLIAAPIMLGLTFYGSYHAVRDLALDAGYPEGQAHIPPLAIDGMLVVLLLFDLLFARMNKPNPFVQNMTRLFIWFTLVANAAAGYPDVIAVFLHIPAPLAIVVMTEVARAAILEQAAEDEAETENGHKPPKRFDKIPFMRWLLAPRSTWGVWRGMILSHQTDYRVALDADMERRDALATLRALSPSQRAQVPGHLARRLRQGMYLTETVREVRALAATVTAGFHLQDVRPVQRPVHTRDASPTGDVERHVDEALAVASVGVDVHTASTAAYTPAPETAFEDVERHVDETAVGEVADRSANPTADVRSTPAHTTDVDEADPAPAPVSETVDVHTGPVDEASFVHTDDSGLVWDRVPDGWTEDATWTVVTPAPTPDVDTQGDHDEDDGGDGDDDGPRGGGGAPAPTAAPVGVLPGQTTIADAVAETETEVSVPVPGPLDVARTALDVPTWDEATTKKARVMALLWETHGDVTAVRAAYADRTGEEVPRELYRAGERGYAYQWHHTVTTYFIGEYGHADTVRAILADAGVDHTHEAVDAALSDWSDTHSDTVLQFRRPVHTGS
ncbi:DUF2637 domain-containing protein [Nocardiopsis alba]|uniref:DUF2637 domain-containing protein n=1 Tax=Nocardiopsis alba TaxID=53437 RepID=UPI0033D95012